ncbi:MAG: glycine/sarcosine/betaine reductase complex component C subunit beta [Actinomycetota bacterium]
MSKPPVITASVQVLAHTPGLARHGSKPSRELPKSAELQAGFLNSLRSFERAVGYPSHQAYIGAMHPRNMPPRPRATTTIEGASRFGPDGEIMPEQEFLGLMASVDEFDLIALSPEAVDQAAVALGNHPMAKRFNMDRLAKATTDLQGGGGAADLDLHTPGGRIIGRIKCPYPEDESLAAGVMLENLANKASGALALMRLLENFRLDPDSIDYVISCAEEAVGDRYQRGGGNMAKGMADVSGLRQASGCDIKNFCAAPIPAMVIAASLVSAGVFKRVAVVAGGSLPKLGMKFQGHLSKGLPVMEDVVGGMAFLVEGNDGASPQIRLDAVGRHRVSHGGSNPQIMEALAVEPLQRIGLSMTDVDDYATELHDPEITEPQGSGNVPERNYKMIAALAARRGDITRDQMPAFAEQRGMPGFSPTQGHLASAICYLPHALRRLSSGDAQRVLLLAKGSLFLGRMSQLSDGMSVLLERPE